MAFCLKSPPTRLAFLYDEPVSDLGMSLKLPPWLEQNRAQIERAVPEI